mgnify:CR=1 FL=1
MKGSFPAEGSRLCRGAVDTQALEAALAGLAYRRVVDADGREALEIPDRSTDEIGALAHAAGVQLASGSQDTSVIVWDTVAESGLFRYVVRMRH